MATCRSRSRSVRALVSLMASELIRRCPAPSMAREADSSQPEARSSRLRTARGRAAVISARRPLRFRPACVPGRVSGSRRTPVGVSRRALPSHPRRLCGGRGPSPGPGRLPGALSGTRRPAVGALDACVGYEIKHGVVPLMAYAHYYGEREEGHGARQTYLVETGEVCGGPPPAYYGHAVEL